MVSNSVEVWRTRAKWRELFYDGKMEMSFENPMKHEEWSKSRELTRTFAPKSVGGEMMTERMTTNYRRAYPDRLRRNSLRDSKSIELRRTVTNSSAPKSWSKCFENPMNYEEWSKSIELDRTVTPDSGGRGYDGTNDNKVSESLRRPAREEPT